MKRFCGGCGGGGDWGLRVRAERDPTAPRPLPNGDGGDGADPPPDRISLLFYLADEEVTLFEGPFEGRVVVVGAQKPACKESLSCSSKIAGYRPAACCSWVKRMSLEDLQESSWEASRRGSADRGVHDLQPQVARPQVRLLRQEAGLAAEAPGRQLAEGFAPGAGAWTLHAQGSAVLGELCALYSIMRLSQA